MKLKNEFGEGWGLEGEDFRQEEYGGNGYGAEEMGH